MDKEECKAALKKSLEKQIHLYQQLYVEVFRDEIPDFEIRAVDNMADAALDAFRKFGYESEYIERAEKEQYDYLANRVAGLTIYGAHMGDRPVILFRCGNDNLLRTCFHELTHVIDYQNYCKKRDLLNISYNDFLKHPGFNEIYLLSEYRAYYRSGLALEQEVRSKGMKTVFNFVESANCLNKDLQEASDQNDFERFQYYIVRFCALCSVREDWYGEVERLMAFAAQAHFKKIADIYYLLHAKRNATLEEGLEAMKEYPALIKRLKE